MPEDIVSKMRDRFANYVSPLPSAPSPVPFKPNPIKTPMYMSRSNVRGILQPGNIDLTTRPVVHNPDGSDSTVRSMSFNQNGKEVLVPTVSDDGRILSFDQAIGEYNRTGRHLGTFDTPDNATEYAKHLHEDYEQKRIPGYK